MFQKMKTDCLQKFEEIQKKSDKLQEKTKDLQKEVRFFDF